MNNRQRRILRLIFQRPDRDDIRWTEIISLFKALNADVEEGRAGSRVWVELNGQEAVFHAPHPQPTAHKGLVRSIRGFLEKAGITHERINDL